MKFDKGRPVFEEKTRLDIRMVRDDQGKSRLMATARCDVAGCTNEHTINAQSGGGTSLPLQVIEKKIRNRGWVLTNKTVMCPKCINSPTKLGEPAAKLILEKALNGMIDPDAVQEFRDLSRQVIDSPKLRRLHAGSDFVPEDRGPKRDPRPRTPRIDMPRKPFIRHAENSVAGSAVGLSAEPPPKAPTPPSPPQERTQPSLKIQVKVVRLLEEHFDATTGRYEAGWSDAKIAQDAETVEPVVVAIRLEGYGELKEDPELKNFRVALERCEQDFLNRLSALESEKDKVYDEFTTATARLRERLGLLERKIK